MGLASEFAFGTHFAGHARDFSSEGVELIDHRVDGVFQLENFAFDVDGDLAREVSASDGGGDFRDVAHLARQVPGHRVHGVGQILPGAGNAGDVGLTSEAAFAAYFASDARHFGGERSQLLNHRIESFFQLEDFAADIDRDLL